MRSLVVGEGPAVLERLDYLADARLDIPRVLTSEQACICQLGLARGHAVLNKLWGRKRLAAAAAG